MTSIFGGVLETVAQVMCISELYCKKIMINRKLLFLIGTVVFLFYGFTRNGYPILLKSVAYVLIFLYCLFGFEKNLKKAIVNYCLSFICTVFSELCISIPITFFLVRGEGVIVYIEYIMSIQVLIMAYFLAKQRWLSDISNFLQKKVQFIVIIVVMVIYVIFLLVQMILSGTLPEKDGFVIIYIGLFLGIMLFEWQKAMREIDRKEKQLLMSRKYAEAYEELILQVRERQHDMKNHIHAIQSIVYTAKNYEELVEQQKAYCKHLVDESAVTGILTSIENPLLAGFMYSKMNSARSKGIEVQYELAFSKEPMHIAEYTIVEMMGILFDNAIEAVIELGLEQGRRLSAVLLRTADKMVFTLSNPYGVKGCGKNLEITSLFAQSNKGQGRGIGMKKLQKMVKEADGHIYVEAHCDDMFAWVDISIELPLRTL